MICAEKAIDLCWSIDLLVWNLLAIFLMEMLVHPSKVLRGLDLLIICISHIISDLSNKRIWTQLDHSKHLIHGFITSCILWGH